MMFEMSGYHYRVNITPHSAPIEDCSNSNTLGVFSIGRNFGCEIGMISELATFTFTRCSLHRHQIDTFESLVLSCFNLLQLRAS